MILILSFVSTLVKGFQFWPPPAKDSWQHRLFLVLFRGFLYPLIALTVLEFNLLRGNLALIQYGAGALLVLVGFGLAFAITFNLGWRNAFGEKLGLRTTGWFSRSRNPIYVVTWIGLIGWGLIANSWMVSVLLAIWGALYVLAPFLEEPWLEREYGQAYRDYKERTPRFI
ncbi:isoprenylcysteine carboxylmethyltransferase family protein [Parvularcula sp. IMCC14364]|uniref:methyltransferase family protein n=1 Tax=Parvularcula sp. IMCC14364 TaxID=3067902 RepID=UPI002741CFDF|nr:PEMT/PEM2 methyltransferase family protein [Parvularcula sp. IMCC14364]